MKYIKYLGLVLVIVLSGCSSKESNKAMKITINKDTKDIEDYLSIIDSTNLVEYNIENLDKDATMIQYRQIVKKNGKYIEGADGEFISGSSITNKQTNKIRSAFVDRKDNSIKVFNNHSSRENEDFLNKEIFDGSVTCKIEEDKDIKLNEEIVIMAKKITRNSINNKDDNSADCTDLESLKKAKDIIIVTMRIHNKKIEGLDK